METDISVLSDIIDDWWPFNIVVSLSVPDWKSYWILGSVGKEGDATLIYPRMIFKTQYFLDADRWSMTHSPPTPIPTTWLDDFCCTNVRLVHQDGSSNLW